MKKSVYPIALVAALVPAANAIGAEAYPCAPSA